MLMHAWHVEFVLKNVQHNALKLEKDEIVVDSDKCILCGECEIICPVNAIKLKQIHIMSNWNT